MGFDSTRQQILRAIKDSGERGVENYKLSNITLGYRGRITELRHEGYNIKAKRVWRDGRASGTYLYYIQADQPKPVEAPGQSIPWMDE